MKSNYSPLLAILLIGVVFISGCVSQESPTKAPTNTEPPITPYLGGEVQSGTVRSIRTTPAGVEIEVTSDREFPVRNELVVLRIGAQEFALSRYPENGDTHTLIFTLIPGEFAKTATGDLVTVQYGRDGKPNEQWNFGPLDKSLLNHTTPAPLRAGATLSKLSVSGNLIVNEEGREIRLRGIGSTDPLWLEKLDFKGNGVADNRFAEIATDFARMKELGANVVRLPLYPGYYFLIGGETYLSTYVDRMVDLAEENELYAIISYHVIGRPGGWYSSDSDNVLPAYPAKLYYTDTDMAVEFWNTVAARYGQRKHVLFEIYNEPADETADFTWADWRPTGQLLIDTVRKHSDNIILGSGPKYTNDLSEVPKNPYSDSNLVYVAHVYPGNVLEGEDQVTEWERTFGFLASTYPVIVSEWGFHDGGDVTTNGTLEGYARPFIDYLDQKKIHWVAFVYLPPDAEPAMLEADWTTLNEFGEFVKERLAQ